MESNNPNNISGNKSFNVENIITRRIDGKKNLYLIKWEGYPITDCTWEPISHLSNIIDMVKEFEENFPQSINQKLLKEFYIEYKKYEHKKFLQRKRVMKSHKNKKVKSNKIIIPLDDYEFECKKTDEEDKEDEDVSKIDSNSIYENNQNMKTACKNIVDSTDILKNDENVFGKLIKPIIIW